jgi:hypothetical protein
MYIFQVHESYEWRTTDKIDVNKIIFKKWLALSGATSL